MTPPTSFAGEPPIEAAEDYTCRSTCDICGTVLTKPSNLIRHMKIAHNRTNFTATVETKGMPAFKIDVFDGRFMWGCCDEVFDDRNTFINHRRQIHGRTYASAGLMRCEYCPMEFRSTASYNLHLRTHRPRVCKAFKKNIPFQFFVDLILLIRFWICCKRS